MNPRAHADALLPANPRAHAVPSLLVILLLGAAASSLAHHSFSAEFDVARPVALSGTVTKIEWMNPHVWFFIDVTDDEGAVTSWGWEMGSPNGLMRRGWTRNSMQVGDIVNVEGWLATDGSYRANARTVTLSTTGQRLFAGSSQGQP